MTIDLDNLEGLTVEELRDAITALSARLAVVTTMEAAPKQIEEIQQGYLAAEGLKPGDPWQPRKGAHDAYPLGWTVEYDGKTWESTRVGNADTPGPGPSWKEIVPEGAPPAEWVQPHAHNAYMTGDRVTFEGRVYESVIDNNAWSPSGYPAGWEEI